MRGDVYQLKANTQAQGHQRRGSRYAVVVQSDALLTSTLIAVPTSTSARPAVHRPEIRVGGQRTRVLTEQLQAVDPEKRFGAHVGRLDHDQVADIEEAIRHVLGLF